MYLQVLSEINGWRQTKKLKLSFLSLTPRQFIFIEGDVPFSCQDRIIARLQQPYSLDCIPVEAEYQVSHD